MEGFTRITGERLDVPRLQESGKSMIERTHMIEVRRLFGNARLRPSHLLQSVQQTHGMDRRYVGGPRAWDDAWRSSTTGRIGTGTKLNWMSIRVATAS